MNEIEKPIWKKCEEFNYSNSSDENYWKKVAQGVQEIYKSQPIYYIYQYRPKMKSDEDKNYMIFTI